jgi:hypothetical protein
MSLRSAQPHFRQEQEAGCHSLPALPISHPAQPQSPPLSSHEALLVACATTRTDAVARQAVEVALSAPDLDWPAVMDLSVRHGIAPCVALHLSTFAEDPRLPPDVVAYFGRYAQRNALRTQVLFRETGRLTRALECAGIRYLVLKGVGLALTVYPDPALRNFADIDILVDPAAMKAAEQVAAACGFIREDIEIAAKELHTTYVAACSEDILSDMLIPGWKPTQVAASVAFPHRVVVELHHGPFRLASGHMRPVEMTAFWQSPQRVTLPEGTSIWIPSREAMLLHLACHAAHHNFQRLLFPLDMIQALSCYRTQLDWERLVWLATHYQVSGWVYRLLEFTQRAMDAEVPVTVLRQLAAQSRAGVSVQPLTFATLFAADQVGDIARKWQRWQETPTLRERLLTLWLVLCPPPSSLRRMYGVRSSLLVALIYLIRPFRLTCHLVRALFRGAQG